MTRYNVAFCSLFVALLVTVVFALNENLTARHLRREVNHLQEVIHDMKLYPAVQEHKVTVAAGSGEYKQTLARQNRNFLNIKTPQNGGYWEGQIGVDKEGHAIFKDPAWSIRAGIIIIKNYEFKHKIDTITKLVKRFCTGNHDAYIKHLCKSTGFKPNQKISLMANLERILLAMIVFESGEKIGMEYIELIKAVKR